jgi:hypothetical protein
MLGVTDAATRSTSTALETGHMKMSRRCDIFQQQAASLLQVLKDIDLLGVICAIAASNFAITVDQVSTHIPRQQLTAMILENLEYNSRMLNGTVTPPSMVQHEYTRRTPANSVLTVTTMQLVSLTFFWGSSFNDGTTQTALDPPGVGPVRTH